MRVVKYKVTSPNPVLRKYQGLVAKLIKRIDKEAFIALMPNKEQVILFENEVVKI